MAADSAPDDAVSDAKAAGREMRNAIAWLARVASSYAAPAGDRLALLLDGEAETLLTPDIAPDGTRLGLHLPSLTFRFLEGGAPTPHPLDVDDRSSTEVEAWLLAELLHRGFDRERFDKRLPYAWDGLMSGDAAKYLAHDHLEALQDHTRRLAEAADVLRTALQADGRPSGDAAEIVFHPDRCSLAAATGGVEVSYEMDAGEEAGYHVLGADAGAAPPSRDRDALAARLAQVVGSATKG